METSKTNEQAFEALIERALVGSTREEREAANLTDIDAQTPAAEQYYWGRPSDFDKILAFDMRRLSSLYYERMGLSKNKKALQQQLTKGNRVLEPNDIIRDPISLEFLGLQSQEVFSETKLETAILNHLQQFLLEMGSGFCFEARQKRILIDKDYFKADLIFYHRILKCHVVVDLKIDRFRHEYASQLNMYLNYYKHEIMQPGDNPPFRFRLSLVKNCRQPYS